MHYQFTLQSYNKNLTSANIFSTLWKLFYGKICFLHFHTVFYTTGAHPFGQAPECR